MMTRPNTRVQRTRSSPSAPHSPLTRHPLGGWVRLAVLLGSLAVTGAGNTPEDIHLAVRVVDRDCQPFPGIRVLLVPAGGSADQVVGSAVTDSNGDAVLRQLVAGRYDALASLPDFVDSKVGPFVLPSKGEFRVTLVLNLSLERVIRLNEGVK
jgi:Carboxypeptidase regulatory-like domain